MVLQHSLPASYTVDRWAAAWAGFDVLLAGLFAATAWLLHRHDRLAPAAGLATAVALVLDAWFDCATAAASDLPTSLLMAAVELPVAAVLTAWAVRATREAE
ncbi:hypothetical protein ADJ73_02070 [Arsenicicoccus sp. oral taxon 190]|nr:hypothetical protein ADJ73_02070 [Arsenicicoccus sp. oral taxon 190]